MASNILEFLNEYFYFNKDDIFTLLSCCSYYVECWINNINVCFAKAEISLFNISSYSKNKSTKWTSHPVCPWVENIEKKIRYKVKIHLTF